MKNFHFVSFALMASLVLNASSLQMNPSNRASAIFLGGVDLLSKDVPRGSMKISPNPVIDEANIEIMAPEVGFMLVQVYSMDGQLVTTLFEGQCEKGINIIKWIKNGLSNGVYTVKTIVGRTIITKKVVLCGGFD